MKKNNVILADCLPDELLDFQKGLQDSSHEKWVIESVVSNWGRSSFVLELRRYIKYFYIPFLIFLRRKDYSKIIGWQQFYALNYCFFCRLFNVKKTAIVNVVNFTYKKKKGFAGSLYHKYMKYIVSSKYVDGFYVPSKEYISFCKNELGINESLVHTLCFGVPDLFPKYCNIPHGNYALAIGRSNRDYDWLIEEWKGINYPLRIISDVYSYDGVLPNHITIINNITGEKQYPEIMGSRIVILPIKEEKICSGDTVLLTALSFKKDVIVTEPSTLAEMYITDGWNGYCVKKEKNCLASCVNSIVNDNNSIGENARESYLTNYSRYSMGLNLGKTLLLNADNK